jgi:hypothetical protein
VALPGEVSYGRVTGRFLLAVADGVDVDQHPDGVPAEGTVTFTASVPYVRFPGSPAVVLPSALVCALDEDGYLLDGQGEQGVYLVATNDPDGNPVDWTYTVSLNFSGILVPPFSIQVPAGAEIDLAQVIPVASSDGTLTIQGPPGAGLQILGTLADETNLPPTGEPGQAYIIDGDLWVWAETDWLNTGQIQGPQGIQGVPGVQGEIGPANELSIGTVTSGETASATVTGDAPVQVLNLVLPQGPQGPAGADGADGVDGAEGPQGPPGDGFDGEARLTSLEGWRATTDALVGTLDDEAVRKNELVANVLDHGATGDGVTDDSAALQAAINFVNALGGGRVFLPAGRYMCTGLSVLETHSNITIEGVPGATILDFTDRDGFADALDWQYLLSAFGSISAGVNLTADVAINANVLSLNTSTFAEGDLIILTSNETYPEETVLAYKGEYFIVDEILSGTQMRVNNATHDSYATASTARVHKVTPVENSHIKGITFIGQGRSATGDDDGDLGVGFTYGRNVSVTDCEFIDIDEVQLEFRSCYNFRAERNYHFHSKYYSPSGGVGTGKPTGLAIRGTVQYQVRVSDCSQYGVIRDCVGDGGRHFFNTGHSYRYNDGTPTQQVGQLFGINRHIQVVNCSSKNTWHANFSTHNDGHYVDFIGCTAENSGVAGFNPRSYEIRVIDCVAINTKYGVLLSDHYRNIEIRGCRVQNVEAHVTTGTPPAGDTSVNHQNVLIHGNYFSDSTAGILLNTTSTVLTGTLTVSGNYIRGTANTGNAAPIRIINWDDVVVSRNEISGTAAGHHIRLEAINRAIVANNILRDGNAPIFALNTCLVVALLYNFAIDHTTDTYTNSATTPTSTGNVAL